MIHARNDYMHIQDYTGKVGKDEPVFLLRAKDATAPRTLRFWANELESVGGDPLAISTVRKHANLMEHWQAKNGCKQPDTPIQALFPDNVNGNDIQALCQMVKGAKVLHENQNRLKWNPDGYWLDGVLVVDIETAFHIAGM